MRLVPIEREANKARYQPARLLPLKNKEIEELTSLLSDQEQIKAKLESSKKDLQLERVEKAETSRRLAEAEEKLENSETAQVTAESLVEPLKDDMLWMTHHGIINGYAECAHHVTNALKVDWGTSKSATCGVDMGAEHAAAKEEYNNLRLPVMDLATAALQSDNFVAQLKEVFSDEADDDEDLE
ncbi:hypothetical protein HanPI659440_Chr15g0608511 [Helianthus annuus]|nr:hypothetical protein HanPI659440_Chr15g0608511 [Helianthus annuus]